MESSSMQDVIGDRQNSATETSGAEENKIEEE